MIISILLTFLKIIGIIFLVLLGILVFLLGMILFVPVRYKLSYVHTGEEGDVPIIAYGYVSWIFHIIHVSFEYPADTIVIIRIMGIPLKINNKKNKKNDKGIVKTKQTNDEIENINTDAILDECGVHSSKKTENIEDNEYIGDIEDIDNNTSIFGRLSELINKIKYTVKSIYDRIKEICVNSKKSINNLQKNTHYYYTVLSSELFSRTYDKCKKRIIKLFKEILPRKFDIGLEAGFEDPYITGELMALAGMIYPLVGEHIHITGNFEEVVLRSAGRIKGRIFGFSLLKLGIFYLTDRDLRRLIRLLKKEEHKNGRK